MKNAELEIRRQAPIGHSILGELWLNDTFFCYTLERVGVAIPAGVYQVLLNMSPKFHKLSPLLIGGIVKASWGVRLHPGCTAAESDGCPLLGLAKLPSNVKIYHGQEAFEKLMGQLMDYGTITLTIR
jgi:hypothetical protein